ncbi:2251_t:CDS:2, partial [Gigaspora margarita]
MILLVEITPSRKSETKKEAKIAPKRDLNITTEIEPTVTTLSRKVILELLEPGLKQTEEIEEFIKNRHKEVIDSLIQDEKNLMMILFGPDSTPSPILQKSEVYNFTLWDIPKDVQILDIKSWRELLIKRNLIEIEQWKTKEIVLRIEKHCKIIENQQGRMIKSLLNKPFRKVTIDKYISRN